MSGPRVSSGLVRALVAGLVGLAALAGPMLLDLWSTQAVRGALARRLGLRLGARVELADVQVLGPTRLRLHGLRITWSGPGRRWLNLPELDLAVAPASLLAGSPSLAQATWPGGTFEWVHPDAQATLRRLLARGRRTGAKGAPKPGGRPRGLRVSGARIDGYLDQVLIQELRPPRGHLPTRWEASRIRVHRAPDGIFKLGVVKASASLASGARLDLDGLRLNGRERGAAGFRVSWLRVRRGRWSPAGPTSGRDFTLVADEVAPDLLVMRLVVPGAGPTPRFEALAEVDALKRTAHGRVRSGEFRLGTVYPMPTPFGIGLPETLLGGSGELDLKGPRTMVAKGQARVAKLSIRHGRLSPAPVTFEPITVSGRLRWNGPEKRLGLEEASLSLGQATLRLDGELRLAPRGGRARIVLAPTGCQALFDSLPAGLLPTLRGLRLEGTLGGELDLAIDSRALDELTLKVTARPNTCRVIKDAPRADLLALRRSFSFKIRPPAWPPTELHMGPRNRDWVPYTRLGRNVIGAFLAAEDRRFFDHKGFDLENIRRALAADLRSRGFAKGASSISQQVAKNVFLTHKRTLARKLEEAILTWRLEQVLDKRRILEIYLNFVEMGPGLFGVRAAALRYFHKEPSTLAPLEAAHLAAITPSPQIYYDRFREGRAGMEWLLHLRYLLFQMHKLSWLDKADYERARLQDLRLLTYDPKLPAP